MAIKPVLRPSKLVAAFLSLAATAMVLSELRINAFADEPRPAPSTIAEIKEKLATDVQNGQPVDVETRISALNRVIGTNPAGLEALALRGALKGQLGRYKEATADLENACKGKLDLLVDIPSRAYHTDDPQNFGMLRLEKRLAVETLYEGYLAQAMSDPFEFSDVEKWSHAAVQKGSDLVSPALLEIYTRDKRLSGILARSHGAVLREGEEITAVFELSTALFRIDHATGTVTFCDSKCAGPGLLRLATLVHEIKNNRPEYRRVSDLGGGFELADGVQVVSQSAGTGDDGNPTVRKRLVIVKRLRAEAGDLLVVAHESFTPIQLTLLALSLPSTSEITYNAGLTLLAELFRHYGAESAATRVGESTAAGQMPTYVERAAEQLLVDADCNAALASLREADAVDKSNVDLIREHTNPILLSSVSLDSPTFAINLLETPRSKRELPVGTDAIQRIQALAVAAAALWSSAHDPNTRLADRVRQYDEALLLGTKIYSLLGAPWRVPIATRATAARRGDDQSADDGGAARRPEALEENADFQRAGTGEPPPRDKSESAILLQLVAPCRGDKDKENPQESKRIEEFGTLLHELFALNLFPESNGTASQFMLLFGMIRNDKAGLKKSPLVLSSLARQLMRHQFVKEAGDCLGWLRDLNSELRDKATNEDRDLGATMALLLEADLEFRNARGASADAKERNVKEVLVQAITVEGRTVSDVRDAILFLGRANSPGFRHEVFETLKQHVLNEREWDGRIADSLSSARLPLFDDYIAGRLQDLAEQHLVAKGNAPFDSWNKAGLWERTLAAAASSGADRTVNALTDLYIKLTSAPQLTAREQYEAFRQIAEALSAIDAVRAFAVACDYFRQRPAALSVDRPNGHRVEFARLLPLRVDEALPSPGDHSANVRICDDLRYWHIRAGGERMTGQEFLEWLGASAQSSIGLAEQISLAIESCRPAMTSDEADAVLEATFAARLDKLLELDSSDCPRWWQRIHPTDVIGECSLLLQHCEHQKVEPLTLEYLERRAALYHFRGTAYLNSLEVKLARSDFETLEGIMAELHKLNSARQTDPTAAKLDESKCLQYARSDLRIAFLPRSMKLSEAEALVRLLDRSADNPKYESDYSAALDTLEGAAAIRGTSYSQGISAMRFLLTNSVPDKGNLPAVQRFLTQLIRLAQSGLVPTRGLPESKVEGDEYLDSALGSRQRNLFSWQAGVRVKITQGQPPMQQSVWVSPEDAMTITLALLDERVLALEHAYSSWIAVQAHRPPGALTVPAKGEVLPQAPAKVAEDDRGTLMFGFLRVGVAPPQSAPLAPLMATLDTYSREVERVRESHRFPSLALAPTNGAIYPPENDQGVAAFLGGDLQRAREQLTSACTEGSIRIRRIVAGIYKDGLDNRQTEPWSLSAPNGRRDSPDDVRPQEFHFVPHAHRNLAILELLNGNFDTALVTFQKVKEFELRGSAVPLRDQLFAPLDLERFYPLETATLRRASTIMAAARSALQNDEPIKAIDLLESLPEGLRDSAPALRLALIARMSRLMRQGSPLERGGHAHGSTALTPDAQNALLRKCDEIANSLTTKKLQTTVGDDRFGDDPTILFLHAYVLDRLTNQKAANDKRLYAGQLLQEGLQRISAAFTAVPSPNRNRLDEWIPVYLEAAPRLLRDNSTLFFVTQGNEPPYPAAATTYQEIITRAAKGSADALLASLVFRPFTEEAFPALDTHLASVFPTKDELQAMSQPDESGMSRLDWYLAALVTSGRSFDASRARSLLIAACETYSPFAEPGHPSEGYISLLDALFAVDPSRCVRIALNRLALLPLDDGEKLLAHELLGRLRRSGATALPAASKGTTDSWYADTSAFWFYPRQETFATLGDRLSAMAAEISATTQQFALLMPEIDTLTQRGLLSRFDEPQHPAPNFAALHARLAELLSESNTPNALALLLRYCRSNYDERRAQIESERQEQINSKRARLSSQVKGIRATFERMIQVTADKEAKEKLQFLNRSQPLSEAASIAESQDYAALAQAPWLVIDSAYGPWKGQLSASAWSYLSKRLPRLTEINEPAPKSSFLDYLEENIGIAIRNRNLEHRIKRNKGESAFADLFYQQIIKAVQENYDLDFPEDETTLRLPAPIPAHIGTLKDAVKNATLLTAAALRFPRLKEIDALPDPKQRESGALKEFADQEGPAKIMVDHQVERLTVQLWCVASQYSADKRSLAGLSFDEIAVAFRGLDPDVLHPRVKTVVSQEPIKGETNEEVYTGAMELKERRIYLPIDDLDDAPAMYEERFLLNGNEITIRGQVPHSYRAALRDQPRFLDFLDISLAKRVALLESPPQPTYLSLDLALLTPDLAWPVLAQDGGFEHLNTYLAASSRDRLATTAQELLRLVLNAQGIAVDIDARLLALQKRDESLVNAKFQEYYAARALAGAQGIPNTIKKKLWGFIKMGEVDNVLKRRFVNDAVNVGAGARVVLGQLSDFDWITKLTKDGDSPRYVYVVETSVSTDKWFCTYRLVTTLGESVIFERGGTNDSLPEICQLLIKQCPELATYMQLDLGGLTADPGLQLELALKITAAIEGGRDSVIGVLRRLGLNPDDLKAVMNVDADKLQFSGRDAQDTKRKVEELQNQARRFRSKEQQIFSPSEYLMRLVAEMKKVRREVESQAGAQADVNLGRVAANSGDINVWGIPGILEFSTQNGKLVGFQVAIAFSGNFDDMSKIQLRNPLQFERVPYDAEPRPDYYSGARWWQQIDPRNGFELPGWPKPIQVPGPVIQTPKPPSPSSHEIRLLDVELTGDLAGLNLPSDLVKLAYGSLKDGRLEVVCPASRECGPLDIAEWLVGGDINVFSNGMFNDKEGAHDSASVLAERLGKPVLLLHNPPNGVLPNNILDAASEKAGQSQEDTAFVGARLLRDIFVARPLTHFSVYSHSEGEAVVENMLGKVHNMLQAEGLPSAVAWCKVSGQVFHMSFGGAHRPSAFANKVRLVQVGDWISRTATQSDQNIGFMRGQFYNPREFDLEGSSHSFRSYMTRVPSLEQFHLAPPLPKYCDGLFERPPPAIGR